MNNFRKTAIIVGLIAITIITLMTACSSLTKQVAYMLHRSEFPHFRTGSLENDAGLPLLQSMSNKLKAGSVK
jgi:hypothetical protein